MNKKRLLSVESNSEAQTKRFASSAVSYFNPGDTILLYGNLGSGKTFLVKQFARALGYQEQVTSPTFAIMHQYYNNNVLIHHIDLYRIDKKNELTNLGFEDIWEMQSINFVEWPQFIEDQVPDLHYRIYITMNEGSAKHRTFSLYKCIL